MAQTDIERRVEPYDSSSGQQCDADPFPDQFLSRIPGGLAEKRQQDQERRKPAEGIKSKRRKSLMDSAANGEIARPEQRRDEQRQIDAGAVAGAGRRNKTRPAMISWLPVVPAAAMMIGVGFFY
jgi:hypothetical protein